MVEVAVASVIIAFMLISSLNVFGAVLRGSVTNNRRATADELAGQLMAELQQLPYAWPPPANIPALRENFTSLADFDGWDASPPVNSIGDAVAADEWRRTVTIQSSVTLAGPLTTAADRGSLRIVVKVWRNGSVLRSLETFRFEAWDEAQELSESAARHVDTANHPPEIIVSQAGPLTGSSPLSVSFDVSPTFDPEGDSLSFDWDFGDSSSGTGSVITHQFTGGSDPKTVTAKLTVSDANGASATKTFPIHIDFE